MQARSGIARAGATRSGAYTPNLVVMINGFNRSSSVIHESVRLSLALNDEPDTATFTMKPGSVQPTAGQQVIVGLGTSANREFGGHISCVVTRRERGLVAHPFYDIECTDWMRFFDAELVCHVWEGKTATEIATDIVTEWTSGFTTHGIQQGLPTIDRFVASLEKPSAVLRRLIRQMGGGGFYIRADRDVRFFDDGGDLFTDAGTDPVDLEDGLSTLKSCVFAQDLSQHRATTFTAGPTSEVLIALPFTANPGAVIFGLSQYGLPVKDATLFSDAPTSYLLIGGWFFATYVFLYRPVTTGAVIATSTTAVANPGDTTIAVTSDTDFVTNAAQWFRTDEGNVFTGNCVSGGASQIQSIPSSGYGSLQATIPSGTMVYMVPSVGFVQPVAAHLITADLRDIPVGSQVRAYKWATDATNADTLASIQGDTSPEETGYQHVIDASELDGAAAEALAVDDVATFSDPAGLTALRWETTDLNAHPGRHQFVLFTGAGPIDTDLTITNVEVSFPVPNSPPWRACQASVVKLAELADRLADVAKG